ncbi:MAG: hypothetical protein KAZ26_01175, partial [Caldilineaceae bacterium]|nr:hypothetical protein [Caldilineaceae bacterium]
LEIERLPVNDIEDQQLKAYLLADAEAITHDLKRSADLLIASYFNDLNKSDQATLRQALLAAARDGADVEAKWQAHADLGDLQPFHWPLEFPEVFLSEGRTGFDGYVGNPPFIGGRRIRGTLGDNYRVYLDAAWPDGSGNADYSAYFFLQAFANLRAGGNLGLIATNTIAQGDTRLTGLAKIEEMGGTIFRATNNKPWPGLAAVVVNVVHIAKGRIQPPFALDDMSVRFISSQLDANRVIGEPFTLAANSGLSFQGSLTRGMGFIIEPEDAQSLLAEDPKNADVVKPYLNGQDLNSGSDQFPTRWVIDFQNWPLVKAEMYPGPMRILEERVYPERMGTAKNRKTYEKIWWQFWRPRVELYATIAPLKRVLVCAIVTKYLNFSFLPIDWVFAHKCCVIASDGDNFFSILQSSLHEVWSWHRSSTLGGSTLNYSPTDCFETFPFPESPNLQSPNLQSLGEAYHAHRAATMHTRQEGLTTTYNRFHDPDESAADIVRLRQLHVEMDHAVAASYGWGDLALGHGFHETAQGVRYTISESARREVLGRLLALNHARYAEEVEAGLHDKKGKGKAKGKRQKVKGKKDAPDGQLGLF